MKKLLFVPLLLTCALGWAQVPRSKHIWIITEENHSYEEVIGNPNMPYYNSLASKYALATQYYSNQHTSISALMWLVAGQPVTSNSNTTSCFTVDNVVRHLLAKGMTWRSYQEDLPYPDYLGLSYNNYVRRHNPLIDFTDTCPPTQGKNSVPFSQMASDMWYNATPTYAYITPNLMDDAHNGTLAHADYWLSQHVPQILARPEFQRGHDGVLFILWDEGNLTNDFRCSSTVLTGCGGRVAQLVIGPQVKANYRSTALYHHQNLLRTVCDALGFSSCPGAAATAKPMADFFATVTITSPLNNSTIASPVLIKATTQDNHTVYNMQVYVDGVLRYQVGASSLSKYLSMSIGTHHITVQAWDTAGELHKASVMVNVN